jgi:integrase/recombinase XerD
MNRLILQFSADLHLQRYSENSVQNHRLDVLRFQEWLDSRNQGSEEALSRIAAAELAEYQAHLARRLKPRSVSRHLSTLRLFFRFLESSGVIAANPMEEVSFPRYWTDLPGLLTPGEVAALLDAPDEAHYLGLRDRAMLELLYSSGVKLHELIALNVDALQPELGFVRVEGRRERMVPLTPRCAALLRHYLAESRPGRILYPEEPCLFPGRNGTRISRVAVWKLIKKHAGQAGIRKNFNARTLRHAFAMHLILGGMDLDAIQVLFGYKSLEATSLYAHVNAPDFQAAYRAYHPLAAGTARGEGEGA